MALMLGFRLDLVMWSELGIRSVYSTKSYHQQQHKKLTVLFIISEKRKIGALRKVPRENEMCKIGPNQTSYATSKPYKLNKRKSSS